MDYVKQSLMWRFFTMLCYKLNESACSGFFERFFNAIKKVFAESVFSDTLRRDGRVVRDFDTSLSVKILSATINAPPRLLSRIYALSPRLWDGSFLIRLFKEIGAHPHLLLSWLLLVCLVMPQERWSNLYPFMLLFSMLLLFWLSSLQKEPRLIKLSRIGAWVVFYFALVFLFALISTNIRTSIASLPRYLNGLIVILLCAGTVNSRHSVKRLLDFATLGIAIASIYAFIQRLSGLSVNPSFVDITANANILGRVFSFFQNPNVFAFMLVIFLPFPLASLFGSKELFRKIFGALVFIMGVVALLMTSSRGAWLAFILEMFVFVLIIRPMLIPLLILAGIIVVPFLPTTILERVMTIFNGGDSSIKNRRDVYESALKLLENRHIYGVGLSLETSREYMNSSGYYVSRVPYVHAHNIFLQIAIEMGLLGLLAFLGAMFSGIKRGIMASFKADSESRSILAASASGIIGMLLCGIADYPLSYPRMMLLFWFFFSVLIMQLNARNE